MLEQMDINSTSDLQELLENYTNIIQEVDEYSEEIIDEGFTINALKNYRQEYLE